MKTIFFTTVLLSLSFTSLSAQIVNGTDTLYGNEWINFDQSYFKVMVAEDGVYQVDIQQLASAGVPVGQISGNQYQLFHNGEEVPIYTSTDAVFSSSDYLQFYGEKNRSELDRHLFQNPDQEMMNPLYSLFTDTSAYFLTWTDAGAPLRFEEIQNDLTSLPPKEEFYLEELVGEYHNYWAQEGYNYTYTSTFNRAEGFSSSLKNVQEFILEPTFVHANGPQANLYVRYSGNARPHKQEISLNGSLLATDEFSNFEVRQLNLDIDNASLSSPVTIEFQGTTDANDKQRVSNLILTYPRQFNAANNNSFAFSIAASGTKKYIEVSDFASGNNPPILLDLTSGSRTEVLVEGGLVKMSVPAGSGSHKMVLAASSAFKSPPSISAVSFIDYSGIDANYLILSNKRLFEDGQGANQVQAYSDYRSSMAGRGFKTLIVEVQQLYDQFGWGLNRHSLAIRNFGLFVKDRLPDPSYMLIVGKGREYHRTRTNAQLAHADNATYYVPSFGVPGADNLLMSQKGAVASFVSIGRLPVENPEEIVFYLDKIKEHETLLNAPSTIEDRLWMKRALHLGGGDTPSLQSQLKGYLDGMKDILEGSEYGAEVHSFFKNSSDPVQISTNEAIFDLINGGLSVITFFGHSGVNTFDFNIDNPVNYKNKGKYPVMFSLGCYIGNIHTATKGVSERFVLFEEGAAIGFVASTGASFVSSLNSYTRINYTMAGIDLYGKPIGDIIKGTNEYMASIGFSDIVLVQQTTLSGDPALLLNNFEGPDYTVDASSVTFYPQRITTQLDSFEISFNIVNLGNHKADTFDVEIVQEFPNGERRSVAFSSQPTPAFQEVYTFNIPTFGKESLGKNRFLIEVDVNNSIDELPIPAAENNNKLVRSNGVEGIELFISDNSVIPVYPPEFSIVGQPDVTLKASTSDPIVNARKYMFEIDTTEHFNSPLKLSAELMQSGGVLKWKPQLNWQENMVYYWRTSPDSLSEEEGFSWNNSSFIYLNDVDNGWNQSHYFQYKKDGFFNVEIEDNREFEFITDFKDFTIKNAVNSIRRPTFFLNNAFYGGFDGVPNSGVLLLWIDSINIIPKKNFLPNDGQYQYGLLHPNGWRVSYFMFNTTHFDDEDNGRKDLITFLEDVVAEGESVILLTAQSNVSSSYEPEEWAEDSLIIGKNLFSVLEQEGAQLIRGTVNSGAMPYVFAYKKGSGKIAEELASSIDGLIDLNFGIPGNWDRGYVESPPIGPASKWNNMIWEANSLINPDTDTTSVSVYGAFPDRFVDTLLFENIESNQFDLSEIDASEFPFLKLRFNSEDSIYRSSAQLKFWRVHYDGVPEFAFNPARTFLFQRDTLQQGEQLQMKVAIDNISDYGSDSLLVRFTIENINNNADSQAHRFEEVLKQDSIIVSYSWDTRNSSGKQQLSIELNPNGDQPELIHQNNFLNTTFYIEKDKRNPLVNVTFDGSHILDGDLVSSNPLISIEISDENEFLPMDDTSSFKIFLKYPGEDDVRQAYFTGEAMRFYPAGSNSSGLKNKAKIEYSPVFENDGIYHLIVQATDVTGNHSGEYDYKVAFKIINKTMISNVLNYPNPFSTSTRFVYTLTGSESPDEFKIQIMTVSGRIVREITQDEIGPLMIGTHTTDFAWDGRDEFGDQLANGVYLYRVLMKKDGKEVERYGTGADRFLKNGYGKMVLLR